MLVNITDPIIDIDLMYIGMTVPKYISYILTYLLHCAESFLRS